MGCTKYCIIVLFIIFCSVEGFKAVPRLIQYKISSPCLSPRYHLHHSRGTVLLFKHEDTVNAEDDSKSNNNTDDAVKRSKAEKVLKTSSTYLLTWSCIYFTFLTIIFAAVDHGLLSTKLGNGVEVDPVAAMTNLCDWLEGHVPNVLWITQPLRSNPYWTKFATAYLLTDLMPTTFLALAVYPFVVSKDKVPKER